MGSTTAWPEQPGLGCTPPPVRRITRDRRSTRHRAAAQRVTLRCERRPLLQRAHGYRPELTGGARPFLAGLEENRSRMSPVLALFDERSCARARLAFQQGCSSSSITAAFYLSPSMSFLDRISALQQRGSRVRPWFIGRSARASRLRARRRGARTVHAPRQGLVSIRRSTPDRRTALRAAAGAARQSYFKGCGATRLSVTWQFSRKR